MIGHKIAHLVRDRLGRALVLIAWLSMHQADAALALALRLRRADPTPPIEARPRPPARDPRGGPPARVSMPLSVTPFKVSGKEREE